MTSESHAAGNGSVLRKKSVDAVLAQQGDPADEESHALRRNLTAKDLMGFGVGIVIGTGIFTLTGVEAKMHAGPAVALSFLIAGVVSLLAALCYAELSSMVPTAGSSYTYAYTTIGEIFAWIIGWDLILEFALGAAVVARGWSAYLQNLFGLPTSMFGESSTINVGAIAIVIALGYVALVGIKESARVTNLLVLVKVAVCLFVVVTGLFYVKNANWTPFIPKSQGADTASGLEQPLIQAMFGVEQSAFGIAGVLTAAAVVFFSYTGFEAVANMGEETRNPSRDLPRGIFGTLALCTVLYVGVALVITGMQKYTELDEGAPIASAFKSVGLGWAGNLISIAAICGMTSVILVDIVAMGRIGFAMGRDGLMPQKISQVHPKYGTPYRITLVTIVLVAVLAGLVPLKDLADMVSIGTLFAFTIVAIAVPVLRRARPDLKRFFRVPFNPLLPALAALSCVYLMANLSLATWTRFVVWLALGLLIYFCYGRRHATLRRIHQGESQDVRSE